MEAGKNPIVPINFYKANVFRLLHEMKSYLWNRDEPITYTLKKSFFAVATFEDLLVVSFQTEEKRLVVYFGLCEISLHF